MSEKIRAFIAVELTAEMKADLAHLQEQLKTSDTRVRWVNPENIHLTLKFLGNILSDKLPGIQTALSRAAGESEKFPLSLGALGAFPSAKSARVIWVGIDEGKDQSRELAQKLESLLAKIGFEKEKRPFRAHLTLGRLKSKPEAGFKNLLDKIEFSSENKTTIEKIILFKSTLTPRGPIYEALFQAPLR